MDEEIVNHLSADPDARTAPSSDKPPVAHYPVMLSEVLELLAPKPGGVYADGTLGAGGHAAAILAASAPDGVLIGMDQDADAVSRCMERLKEFGDRAVIRRGNYRTSFRSLRTGLQRARRGPARYRRFLVSPEVSGTRVQLSAGRAA